MNHLRWSAVIAWGVLLTVLGVSASPSPELAASSDASSVVFLIAGGLVTSLVGAIGLMGFMGWIPGLRSDRVLVEKSYS